MDTYTTTLGSLRTFKKHCNYGLKIQKSNFEKVKKKITKTEINTFTFLRKENTLFQPSLEMLHFFNISSV